MIHDRNNQFREIRKGVMNIAGRNFMPNSTVQLALPSIIKNTPKEFFDDNSRQVYVRVLSQCCLFIFLFNDPFTFIIILESCIICI